MRETHRFVPSLREVRAWRLPRPRFTVRGMMVAVAVAAVLCCGYHWLPVARARRHRAVNCQWMAYFWGLRERACWQGRVVLIKESSDGVPVDVVETWPWPLPRPSDSLGSAAFDKNCAAAAAKCHLMIDYFAMLAQKYDRAALYMWEDLPPDPPPPSVWDRPADVQSY
jgi:hypothetical protein